MKQKPLVGIAIPVYNGAEFIRECLNHILEQTYVNWICYITDNASTDGTYEIIKDYEAKDSRFKVFRNSKTIRAFENFNMAYYNMRNVPDMKYAIEFPADDWMFPTCIEKKVAVLERSTDIGACFSYEICGSEVQFTNVLDFNEGDVFDGKTMLHRYLKDGAYFYGSLGTPMYRVNALRQINADLMVYNEYNAHCDVELANDILQNWQVGFVYEILNYFRKHEGQGLTLARNFNTDLYGHEVEFQKHMSLFDDLNEAYHQHRLEYAWFLIKMRKTNQQDILAWHKKFLVEHLNKPITKSEYCEALKNRIKKNIMEIKLNFIRILSSILMLKFTSQNIVLNSDEPKAKKYQTYI